VPFYKITKSTESKKRKNPHSTSKQTSENYHSLSEN